MTTLLRTTIVCVVTGGTLAWSAPASAQQPDQRAAAQVLFDQARALVDRGSFGEACPKFAESLKLDRGLGTMLWLADCYENNGQTASAWVTFKEAAAAAALQRDAREKVARDRAAALEKKLSRLQIIVPPEVERQGVQLARDGVAIGAPEHGLAVPVDPGVHAVSATAPGRRAWSTNVPVSKQDQTVAITVPVLEVDPAASSTSGPTAAAAPAGAPPDASASSGATQRTVGLVVGAVGLVGVGVGALFGLQAKSTYDDSNADGHCLPDNRCDATGKSLRSDAETQALIATIAVGAGAAALVTGGVLLLTAPKDRGGVTLAPSASPQGGGLTLRARF